MHHKNLPLSDCQIKVNADNGRFSGYASTFGNVDAHKDTVIKGAYARTLAEDGLPKMFFNHDGWGLPVGKWLDAGEDDIGLRVEGELTLGSSHGKDVHAAMKHGTIDGLSIGYHVRNDGYEERDDGVRVLKEIRLIEISPVTFPADGFARIDLNSVKFEAIESIDNVKDLERFLREVVGCSKGFSMALLARVKTVMTPGDPAADLVKAKEADFIDRWAKRLS